MKPQYDFVIVGAGTIGLFVANHLLKLGKRLCIIEAGNKYPSFPKGTYIPDNSGKEHGGITKGRVIGLGGTSTLWGGQLAEFSASDLTKSNHEWPIEYAELRSYYRNVYEALKISEPKNEAEILRKFGVGFPLNGDVEVFFTSWLRQPNFARVFGSVIDNKSVDLRLNTNAYSFEFEKQVLRAINVVENGRKEQILAKNCILAAGTMGNTQIMLSSMVHKEMPWQNNPTIGAYFHDHLGGKAGSLIIHDENKFRQLFENGSAFNTKLQPKLRSTEHRAGEPGVCGFFGYRSRFGEQIDNLKRLLKSIYGGASISDIRSLPKTLFSLATVIAPVAWRYVKARRIMALYDQGVDFLIQAEQWPVSESAIIVKSDTPDKNGLLPIQLNWKIDGREHAAIADFVSKCQSFLEKNGIAELRPSAWISDKQNWIDALTDTYHQSGGLRMSKTPTSGVTNEYGIVWGTNNLAIAGACVLPSSSHANCTLTALALAMRTADRLTNQDHLSQG